MPLKIATERAVHITGKLRKEPDTAVSCCSNGHGAPISAKAMERLFLPFSRGDRPSQQGLGLGLYIASEIARSHGGTLQATSTPEATRFEFMMPLLA
jgi:signal transduction histidine kinase